MTVSHASCILAIALVAGAISHVAVAEDRLPGETILASRGGATVRLIDVDASLSRLPVRQRADAMNSPKRIEELISQLLLTRQLSQAGAEQGLDREPIVKHAIEMAAENVVGGQAILKYRESVDVGDVEKLARERYDVNPSAYDLPARVTVRHILIDKEKHSDAEASALVEQLHSRAAKEDFEALVMQYSEDPSKSGNKGVIMDADGNNMDADFAAASAKLRAPGELAPVVKSQFGYHVIKLENRTEPKPRSFEELRVALVEELRMNLTEQRVKEYVDQLRSMSLDANPDAVASLRTRYVPAPLLPDISKAQAPAKKDKPNLKKRSN